jgi:uncharacterized protein (DUF2235 family)
MANGSRNLIVLSDGTGNSASAPFKTNVWRLYQAVKLTDGTQIAVFGDGVGSSSVKILRVLGLALGFGVKRNVLNLYKFLCRNYNSSEDRIWAFGFSRGAFTIRVLVGLIHREGLVSFASEAELNRNALAAYRAYRRKAFPTVIPWIVVGRFLRDQLVSLWGAITGARSYAEIQAETSALGRTSIKVHFVGVWDTVVAYGLPVDELTQAVDKWVWPMKFRDDSLLRSVKHARQALSLDDERRTFHPIPWNEKAEKDLVAKKQVAAGRLRQVWFAGMHADVGGGYPDDGLSYVPLCWMIKEADDLGLRFEPSVVSEYYALASPTGRMYDSRSGFGVLWRYQPRDAQMLLCEGNTPLVHGSVVTRMTCGNGGYSPISLPEKIDVLLPNGSIVAFDAAAVQKAIGDASAAVATKPEEHFVLQERRRVLADTEQLVTLASQQPKRKDLFKLVLDTVWWRRVVYFVSLGFVLIAVAFPLLSQSLRIEGLTDHLNDRAGGPVGWTLGLIKGFLPGLVEPWLTAVIRNPVGATLIIIGLLASLRISGFLQRRICDRARAAWNVRPNVGNIKLDRLAPTCQRHALAKATVVFTAFAIGAWFLSDERWLFILFAGAAILFGLWWAYRRYRRAPSVDPTNPNALLHFARKARTSRTAVQAYRFVAQKLAPAAFLAVSALLVASLAHRAVFDLLSTGGEYCKATQAVKDESDKKVLAQQKGDRAIQKAEVATQTEILGPASDFRTDSICHATKLRLIAGRQYRIQLDIDEGPGGEWFDKGRRTDVAGFSADDWLHLAASPLKRWWREVWFQPIARIGEVGNYEHVLRPVAPLPVLRSNEECSEADKKRAAAWDDDIPSPAPTEFKNEQIACDNQLGARPSRVLISDITADATGELFLYVNDAVLTWPGRTGMFYRNNGGTAKVTVKRILAMPVIESQ